MSALATINVDNIDLSLDKLYQTLVINRSRVTLALTPYPKSNRKLSLEAFIWICLENVYVTHIQ